MDKDIEHIKLLKQGSPRSFKFLYEQYVGVLYSFVIQLTDDRSIVQDIVQETFIRIWLNREKIDESQSFKNYIFTIARNSLLNELRRKVNQTLSLDSIIETDLQINQSVEQSEYNELLIEKIKDAKKKLTPRQLQLFEMSKEQGMTVEEISKLTNLSGQTIRNQVHLAIKAIREYVGPLLLLAYLLALC